MYDSDLMVSKNQEIVNNRTHCRIGDLSCWYIISCKSTYPSLKNHQIWIVGGNDGISHHFLLYIVPATNPPSNPDYPEAKIQNNQKCNFKATLRITTFSPRQQMSLLRRPRNVKAKTCTLWWIIIRVKILSRKCATPLLTAPPWHSSSYVNLQIFLCEHTNLLSLSFQSNVFDKFYVKDFHLWWLKYK